MEIKVLKKRKYESFVSIVYFLNQKCDKLGEVFITKSLNCFERNVILYSSKTKLCQQSTFINNKTQRHIFFNLKWTSPKQVD